MFLCRGRGSSELNNGFWAGQKYYLDYFIHNGSVTSSLITIIIYNINKDFT